MSSGSHTIRFCKSEYRYHTTVHLSSPASCSISSLTNAKLQNCIFFLRKPIAMNTEDYFCKDIHARLAEIPLQCQGNPQSQAVSPFVCLIGSWPASQECSAKALCSGVFTMGQMSSAHHKVLKKFKTHFFYIPSWFSLLFSYGQQVWFISSIN